MTTQELLEAGLETGLKGDLGAWMKEAKATVLEQGERIHALEAQLSKGLACGLGGHVQKSLGNIITEHEQFKNFASGGYARSGRIPVASFTPYLTKAAIVSDPNTSPLAQPSSTIAAGRPALRLRDVMTVLPATSDHVEYVKLVAATSANAAAPQGKGSSPQVYQNVAKAESTMNFVLASQPIETVAHWIPASRQVLSDDLTLANFVNLQMLFWLLQAEENQLLNGTNAGGDLNGLMNAATAYDGSYDVAGDTRIDRACATRKPKSILAATVRLWPCFTRRITRRSN